MPYLIRLASILLALLPCVALAQPEPIVDGHARFTVLTPSLVRLEYAEGGRFEDRPSFFAMHRGDLAGAPFVTQVRDGWREIRTDALTLRYRRGSGPFSQDNVEVVVGKAAEAGRPRWTTTALCRIGRVCQVEHAARSDEVVLDSDNAWYTGYAFTRGLGASRDTVAWTLAGVERAGTYRLAVRYAALDTTTVTLSVGGVDRALALPPTSRYDRWTTTGIDVPLQPGDTRVALSCAEDCAVQLDYLAAAPSGAPLPEVTTEPTPGNLGGWEHGLGNIRGAIPLHDGLLSRNGWYLLDDSVTPLWNADTSWVRPRPTHRGTYQDGYLFAYGKDYATALSDFARLTGPPPLLPRWAFGIWFSRLHAYSATDYQKDLLPRFRSERVPLDVLVIDTDFKAPDRWNGWNWNTNLFPDPQAFLDWTDAEGLQVALNIHPAIHADDPQYATADSLAGGLVDLTGKCPRWQRDTGACGGWDWGRPRHAASYLALHQPFEQQGVDFWWLDWCCDASRVTMPGLVPDSWINHLYAERLREQGRRGFVLSRMGASWQNPNASFPGPWAEHRSTVHFTGDTYPTWEMLGFQTEMTVAEGYAGLPYVSHDVGSFHAGGPRADALESEMYLRWVQQAVFQPIFRMHGHGYRVPWQYEEPYRSLAARFMRYRHALIPYLYTLAREARDTGLPMARGLPLAYPDHDEAYAFDQQHLLGNQLLVAPVADTARAVRKPVWFPPGTWFDVFTGQRHDGPRVDTLTVPLERLPVFARAGSVVPTQPYMDYVGQHPADSLLLDVYPGDDGAFVLYEDAGEGLAYQHGASARTELTYSHAARRLVIGAADGDYAGRPARRSYRVAFVQADRPAAVHVDGRAIPEVTPGSTRAGWCYDADNRRVVAELSDHPTDRAVTLELVF